jgi:nucleoid DNA-binding protein|tara:strand:- start:986 stop:1303 length:318 start_codon:yes stop_codon:yes gene_type:complete
MSMEIQNRNNTKKKDIIKIIFTEIGIPSSYISQILDDLLEVIIFNLNSKKYVKIANFGTFNLQKKNKRLGRNPKNNKEYEIDARNVVTFKISEKLKSKINNDVKK